MGRCACDMVKMPYSDARMTTTWAKSQRTPACITAAAASRCRAEQSAHLIPCTPRRAYPERIQRISPVRPDRSGRRRQSASAPVRHLPFRPPTNPPDLASPHVVSPGSRRMQPERCSPVARSSSHCPIISNRARWPGFGLPPGPVWVVTLPPGSTIQAQACSFRLCFQLRARKDPPSDRSAQDHPGRSNLLASGPSGLRAGWRRLTLDLATGPTWTKTTVDVWRPDSLASVCVPGLPCPVVPVSCVCSA